MEAEAAEMDSELGSPKREEIPDAGKNSFSQLIKEKDWILLTCAVIFAIVNLVVATWWGIVALVAAGAWIWTVKSKSNKWSLIAWEALTLLNGFINVISFGFYEGNAGAFSMFVFSMLVNLSIVIARNTGYFDANE